MYAPVYNGIYCYVTVYQCPTGRARFGARSWHWNSSLLGLRRLISRRTQPADYLVLGCASYNMSSTIQYTNNPFPKPIENVALNSLVRTGFPAVIQHSLSEHLKCLKPKTWNNLTSTNLFFLRRRMRSAAKRVEQSMGNGYLSKMEWFSLCPQHV